MGFQPASSALQADDLVLHLCRLTLDYTFVEISIFLLEFWGDHPKYGLSFDLR